MTSLKKGWNLKTTLKWEEGIGSGPEYLIMKAHKAWKNSMKEWSFHTVDYKCLDKPIKGKC